MEDVEEIVRCFTRAGARAKISSIHVNGWFGDYDKLAMTRMFFKEVFGKELDRVKEQAIFIGDSPNDAPMFGFFPNSVAVANMLRFKNKIEPKPAWITKNEGGYGFAEMVNILLSFSVEVT
jgi:3-deoxy-D-manno-octulosonate 8-phosphate phosphatase KdsC-like HAD superfamily phosphatase